MPSISPLLLATVWAAAFATVTATRAQQDPLDLDEAVRLAVTSDDPALSRLQARAEALAESAVADAQLPDPMITGALANVPVDSFAFDEYQMTQIKLGLRQQFPAGDTLEIRGQRRLAESAVERARRALALRRIALRTRRSWLELYYRTRAQAVVREARAAVQENIESLSARFATGQMNAQDALRAELELALFDDRLTEHRRRAEVARAGLARYVGEAALRPLPSDLPGLPTPAPVEALEPRLADHPAVRVEDAEARAADAAVRLAEQAYKPEIALEGGYGIRTDRTDFASIGATVSLPLFPDKRQDRRRAAALHQRGAERLDRDLRLRELRRDLQQTHADWRRFSERVRFYRQVVSQRARETAEASVTTYANNRTDFAELVRSQLAELELELKRIELETDAAKAWARLEFLAGETP